MSDLPEKVASVIPYFFFDLFVRIIPGLYFIGGFLYAFREHEPVKGLLASVDGRLTIQWVIGASLVVMASLVVGLLVSYFSRWLWQLVPPINLAKVREWFGANRDSELEIVFKDRFGQSLDFMSKNQLEPEKKWWQLPFFTKNFKCLNDEQRRAEDAYLCYCSRLCHLAVAKSHGVFDTVAMRVDSEDLLSRSFAIASLFLLALGIPWKAPPLLMWTYSALAVVSYLSFKHYQSKAIRERFQMFLIVHKAASTS